jgi:type IV secretion system protein VirB9
MNPRNNFVALGLIAGLTALPAFPETAPKPGSHDARVTYAGSE